ncbi:Protein N-acetyltransferase, RimJ/RimL family [Evansella caseinilytica]|uniref:Protein N-acetyltransferase, RimJ/RimL family n=1 Tax=Evansella caseinilytica TaxID=1503961 RepID=A0A1H3QAH9_9BACI|nr:GNAT family protein [Evansella caseinilytica]SDZ10141.1 Protein N-acetyltransferase, RimJ/RimL family [Evansella caseinilytica]
MKPKVSFNSQRLHFRSTTNKDLDFVLSLENNDENKQYILTWTKEKHIEAVNDPDMEHLVMEEVGSGGRPVGFIILAGIRSVHQNIELMRIVIAAKGKGYGKEAVKAIQKYVFEELHSHRLWLDVKDDNERAKHLYQSSGFRTEGHLKECIKVGDRFASLIIMAMLAEEYRRKQ